MKKIGVNGLLILAGLYVLQGCATSEEMPVKDGAGQDQALRGAAAAPVDEAFAKEIREEKEVGKLMAAKLLGHFGIYQKDPDAMKYVNLVGQTLAQQFGRPELEYHFGILDTDEVNAFATPGGYVFVTRGLLASIKSEAELAHVVGHEIGHVNAKHMYSEIRKKREVSAGETVTRILSRGQSDIGANIAKMVDEGIKKLLEKGLGKEKEYEADSMGAVYAASLGYDPSALVGLIQRREAEKKTLKISKTHPPYKERIEKLQKFIRENGLAGASNLNGAAIDSRFVAGLKGTR